MSASSRPTFEPDFARDQARFTAVVDLPTPPLPLATAMIFFTCPRDAATGEPVFRGSAPRVEAVMVTLVLLTPGKAIKASSHCVFSCSFTGQAGVVKFTSRLTSCWPSSPPVAALIFTLRTKPSVTMSLCKSGSWTTRSAFSTVVSSRVTGCFVEPLEVKRSVMRSMIPMISALPEI